jgi:hypothetical protein
MRIVDLLRPSKDVRLTRLLLHYVAAADLGDSRGGSALRQAPKI